MPAPAGRHARSCRSGRSLPTVAQVSDHGALVHPGAEIDEGWASARRPRPMKADGGRSPPARRGIRPSRNRLSPQPSNFRRHLVPPRRAAGPPGMVCHLVEAERDQHSLLQPLVDAPAVPPPAAPPGSGRHRGLPGPFPPPLARCRRAGLSCSRVSHASRSPRSSAVSSDMGRVSGAFGGWGVEEGRKCRAWRRLSIARAPAPPFAARPGPAQARRRSGRPRPRGRRCAAPRTGSCPQDDAPASVTV